MEITCQEEKSASEWDRYVGDHPESVVYHRWGWKEVVEESFGHRTYYLSARQEGRIVGILPLVLMKSRLFGRFLVSMPFFNYGGLVSDRPEAEARLLAEAETIVKKEKVDFVELRHFRKRPQLSATKEHKVTMILNLEKDPEGQWKALGTKLRNHIRKAQKSNLSFSIGGAELLADFYQVFSVNMRDLGTPVYSKRLFERILARFDDSTKILSVRYQDRPVAAGLVLGFRDTLEIPWSSSIREYNFLCPNTLLYWEALRWAISSGFERFDFGRSTPGEGTYKFKEQWGAKPVPLYWQYLLPVGAPLPDLSPKNAKYRLAIGLWRRCPIRLTQWLGPRIVKHIP